MKRLGLDDHADALAKFWAPLGGPHWDALALVTLPGHAETGVLLPEGKSYPGEMLAGSPLNVTNPTSTRSIEKALAWTQGTLGRPLNIASWTPLYQNANRLAHVYWLRSRGVRAWLVHLLFTGDPRSPTTDEEWKDALANAETKLGRAGVAVDAAAHVLLPAGTGEELLG